MNIGLGTGIQNAGEFNRRAFIALRNVEIVNPRRHAEFSRIREKARLEKPIDDAEQRFLYQLCHDYRGQIGDQLVKDYAAGKAKGADL